MEEVTACVALTEIATHIDEESVLLWLRSACMGEAKGGRVQDTSLKYELVLTPFFYQQFCEHFKLNALVHVPRESSEQSVLVRNFMCHLHLFPYYSRVNYFHKKVETASLSDLQSFQRLAIRQGLDKYPAELLDTEEHKSMIQAHRASRHMMAYAPVEDAMELEGQVEKKRPRSELQ